MKKIIALFLLLCSTVASTATEKTLNIVVGYPPAAAFHNYALLLSRHITKHMPGDYKVTVRNMPGASGLVAINWLYNAVDKDSLTMVLSNGSITSYDSFKVEGAKYDAKKFNYIGSMVSEINVCHVWHKTNVTSFEQAKQQEIILGEAVVGTRLVHALNKLTGSKFKVVSGYPGSSEVFMAMEREEVQGRCGISWSGIVAAKSDWIEQKKIIPILQISTNKHFSLQDVPLALDLAVSKEARQILEVISLPNYAGRVLTASPMMPKENVALLRNAFNKAVNDKELLDEANKLKLEISPLKAQEIERVVDKIQSMPPEIIKEAASVF